MVRLSIQPLKASKTGDVKSVTQPLVAATLVALDLETTGLDIAKDRLIQVGGIRIQGGQVEPDDSYESLVNPSVDIPAKSFAVHGIGNKDLLGKPAFPEIVDALDSWIGESVVVGYSVGFDIAILRREHELEGIPWQPPAYLDIAVLAKRVLPALPDYSLDMVATSLGVTIEDRHSAMGDAMAAAEVFVALLPRLRERGIRTVGEALRVCQESKDATPSGELPPWERISDGEGKKTFTEDQLSPALDARRYCLRVADLLKGHPEVMQEDQTVGEALSRMMTKGISSVFIGYQGGCQLCPEESGVVTERDILRAIDRLQEGALSLPLARLATRPLESIHIDEFVYRANGRMTRCKIRHLAVHDDDGVVVGAISARDLLKGLDDAALINLDDSIDLAETPGALGQAWSALVPVSRSLFEHGIDGRDIASVVSYELCALTRRACELAEAEMAVSEWGPAPRNWAMMVLGSGGRGESLLAMDQDNAIVYSADGNGMSDDDTDCWFAELGTRVAGMLDTVGVPYCQGGVMAMNKRWRRSLKEWKQEINTWVSRQRPEDILNVDIFYDAQVVYGDMEMGAELMDTAFAIGSQSRTFLSLLRLNACRFESATGFLGRWKLEEGRLDAKKCGLMPVFSAARVLAIQAGIRVRSTRERLENAMLALDEDNSLREVHENLLEVHRIVMSAIIGQQLRDMARGVPPSNRVAPAEMTLPARQRLKWALDRVDYVSNLLGVPQVHD